MGEAGKPPCLECYRTGQQCLLAPSRRGGDYSQFRVRRKPTATRQEQLHSPKPDSGVGDPATSWPDQPVATCRAPSEDPDEEPICAELLNPSDALHILARAGSRKEKAHGDSDEAASKQAGCFDLFSPNPPSSNSAEEFPPYASSPSATSISAYKLVENGVLLPALIQDLVHMSV